MSVRRWLYKPTGQDVQELGGFSVLLADPAWQYSVEGGRGAADKHYSTLSVAELCLLPVERLAAPDAVLFLWATWPLLPDAFALMRAWGFRYKNCGFVWAKTNRQQATPFVGLGRWTRGNTEPCLMGVRGRPIRANAAVQQLLVDGLVVAPVGVHSEKPDEVRRRILQLMGDVSAIELFARRRVEDWECFGNEVESTVILEGSAHEGSEAEAADDAADERAGGDAVGEPHCAGGPAAARAG